MDITNLWQKYKAGTATPEELTALDANLKIGEGITQMESILYIEWEQTPLDTKIDFSPEATFEALKQKMAIAERQRDTPLKSINIVKSLRRVAAAIILLSMASALIWWQANKKLSPIVKINETQAVQQITLTDGTKVWLNRDSRLVYQKDFNKTVRSVAIQGEAFFEVATDSTKPFIVSAGDVQTKVLGTSFNVRAFQEQGKIEVALVKGKIQVTVASDTTRNILSPGEKFSYRTKEKKYSRNNFEQDEPYAWKDEIIYFQKAPVQEVAQKLQARYGIRFTIEQENQINGKLVLRYDTKEMTLNEILANISSVMDYKFIRKTKDEILIRPK